MAKFQEYAKNIPQAAICPEQKVDIKKNDECMS